MSLQFVLAFTDLISKNVMKKSTPSLFDSFDINKTSISKIPFMKYLSTKSNFFTMTILSIVLLYSKSFSATAPTSKSFFK